MPLQQQTTSIHPPHGHGQRHDHSRQNWWVKSPWWAKYVFLPLTLGFTGMTTLLFALRAAPLPDESFLDPTRIETTDGKVLSEWTLRGVRSEQVPIRQIPASLQEATLAVEDARFYQHHAVSPRSMMRALWVDAKSGHVVEGGSTITQQLVKNLFLSQERTLTRKVHEALLSLQLELHESKQDILNQYLNTIYYGHGAYGVGAASLLYFGKPVSDLSLAESAMLAGLPKGPSIYSPLLHPDAAKERQRTVLDRMVQVGAITEHEADAAYQQPLSYHTAVDPIASAPYFTHTALEEAKTQYHITSEALYRGGIRITTTLDPVLQHAAEHAIRSSLPPSSNIQAAIVAMDPETGAIKAMVGGRDYATSPYNRVFAERQPGSTFKAVLYTAALQNGWTPADQVNSEITTFLYDKDKMYTVHDYGDFYAHRPLTMREAIARSDNVYAVTTNLDIGPDSVIEEARKMGVTTPLSPYPALALGVFPTSPLQMATVYATLANGGYRVVPHTVEQVKSPSATLTAQPEGDKTQVIPDTVAFQMTDLMKSVLAPGGTGYKVRQYLHGPAAAKTGTTDTDAWMVGYTPKLVCAVWVGYDNNKPLSLNEEHLAGPIWAKFMGTAQQRVPSQWYQPPLGLEKRVIDPVTAELATNRCSTTETDYFAEGTGPKTFCSLHPAQTEEPKQQKHFPWWQKWLWHR
ncbi:transglycosylase domain-containing protein [Alicyclobacillus mengziensis]|uniref:PBP1A family penicillin-binding protein n=1 Tax=Alicyclobacillus mengziensis TaxID=2931921 RepID=A0A9X7VZC9_9BACL|nr:PBP1A family penicillin-binding protein [Alicyclobacillus mengziensis]QSO47647.1 PBP1A family penicillin-binding protein [Alicyclobacillus mengziensis]